MIRARLPRKAGQSKHKRAATPPRSLRAATSGTQKQNNGRVCNFFAIRNCSSSPIAVQDIKTAGNQPYSSLFARSRDRKESLIAKKLQKCRNICFCEAPIVATRQIPQRVSRPNRGIMRKRIDAGRQQRAALFGLRPIVFLKADFPNTFIRRMVSVENVFQIERVRWSLHGALLL